MVHGTTRDQGSRNKALVRRYLKAYERGEQEGVNRFLHPKHLYHAPGGSAVMSRRERIRDEAVFFKAFSSIRTTIAAQLAEGRMVASRVKMIAIHTGDYQKCHPTGWPVVFAFIDIVAVSAGKVREEWTEFDMMSILEQLRINARIQEAK
jgi:predicted ester cyclase